MKNLINIALLTCGALLASCEGPDKATSYQVEEAATVSISITGMT